MIELFSELDSKARVLDLGCGKGSFSYRDCRCQVLALDSAYADVAPATLQCQDGRVHVLVGKGDQLPLASESVDLVIANHVFEHVPEPRQVALEISRVLKPSGILFATVPDGFSFSDANDARFHENSFHREKVYTWCAELASENQKTTPSLASTSGQLFDGCQDFFIRPAPAEIAGNIIERLFFRRMRVGV